MLQCISFIGLGVMVGLAWLMSSARRQISWRLVATGILLQLIVAGVLFNSQSWTFPRRVQLGGLTDLANLVAAGEVTAQAADAYVSERAGGMWRGRSLDQLLTDLSPVETAQLERQMSGYPLRVPRFPNGVLFYGVEQFFRQIKVYVDEGARFVFNLHAAPGDRHDPLLLLKSFAFGVLPTVIFFSALMSVLYYAGVMRWVVDAMAWLMRRVMGTSGAESLAAAANVLIGQTEAPLVIKPYIAGMTRSELNALMVGGFATISGSLMAIFVARGVSAGHLLAASIISAPASLVIAKILQPETEQPTTVRGGAAEQFEQSAVNVIDAAAQGATDGMKLAINVTAMLIAFLALLKFFDSLLWLGGEGVERLINLFLAAPHEIHCHWTLNGLLGYLFYPLAWVMGIEARDCRVSAQLLGTKMVANEFVAYMELGDYLDQMRTLGAAAPVQLSERTQTVLTYALCGFSNFASIGIQIGGIGALAPERRGDLAQLGLRAMLGGTLACCMTACVAGFFDGILH